MTLLQVHDVFPAENLGRARIDGQPQPFVGHVRRALHSNARQVWHRLSTVERADRIVVLSKGRVVESGTHAALLAKAGHYAQLHRIQVDEAAVGAAVPPLLVSTSNA